MYSAVFPFIFSVSALYFLFDTSRLIPAAIAGLDIIALTSLNEGTPVSLIEAQAACIPVITTDVGGVKDIILDGETGFIVPKNSIKKYTEKLLVLIEDENKRKKITRAKLVKIQNSFE